MNNKLWELNGNILIELTKSDHQVVYNTRKFLSLI